MDNSSVYLIKLYNEEEMFFKIGTTVHKFSRFYQLMNFGYHVEIIYMVRGLDMSDAYKLEYELKQVFAKYNYTPAIKFGGYTECFKNLDVAVYKSVINTRIKLRNNFIENLEISWR